MMSSIIAPMFSLKRSDRTVHLRSKASLNQPLKPGARLSICSNTSNCSEFQRKAPAFTQELFNYSLINWEN